MLLRTTIFTENIRDGSWCGVMVMVRLGRLIYFQLAGVGFLRAVSFALIHNYLLF